MTEPRALVFDWLPPVVCFALGAVLFGCDAPEPARRIGTVQMDSILADFAAQAVPGEAGAGDTGTAAADWPPGLDAALDAVAEREEVVLFPAGTVAAGARDYTFDVELELARSTGRIGFLSGFGCAAREPATPL